MAQLPITNGDLTLSCQHSGSDGAPVLFLHGMSASSDMWAQSMERLGGRFDCWALDFRGHGGSDRAAGRYQLDGYTSDAVAVLERIGRPTVVVGHSLGGVTAAHLAHQAHRLVAAVFLVDPPLYLADPAASAATIYPERFRRARQALMDLAAAGASLEAYLEVARNTPSAMGGVEGDHLTARHLQSRARQLAAYDPSAFDPAIDGTVFATFDVARAISCPVTLLAANPALGASFLAEHHAPFAATNPHARIVDFPEVGHMVHATTASEAHFLDELDAFVTAQAGS